MSASILVAGVLLAGGRSSRFGGGDKCFALLAGRPLLTHAIERLAPQIQDLAINANGDPSRFAEFRLPVIADSIEGHPGPLAGLLAGMDWAATLKDSAAFVATAATDTPFFPCDLVARLAAAAQDERPAIAASASGVHPVFGLWPLSLAAALRSSLDRGERKALDFSRAQGAIEVAFPPARIGTVDVDPFFNINRASDLAEAETVLQG